MFDRLEKRIVARLQRWSYDTFLCKGDTYDMRVDLTRLAREFDALKQHLGVKAVEIPYRTEMQQQEPK